MTTLQTRLVMVLMSLLAVVLTVFSTVVYLLAAESIRADIDQFAFDKAIILGRQVNPVNPAWILYDEREWRSFRFTSVGQTFDTNWNPQFVSARLTAPIPATESLKRAITHPSGVVLHDAVGPEGEKYRMATVTVVRSGELYCYAQIGVLKSERHQELVRLLLWLIGGSAVTWIGAWGAVMFLFRQWRVPLALLGETARRVRIQNLSRQRLFVPRDVPELAQVAEAFNDLLDQLEAAHASQQRFVADASHELRTPLTILRGEIDVALRRERAGEDYRAVLESCREEIERLSRLADNLLTLARADAGEAARHREGVNLGAVCTEVCARLRPMAAAREVTLAVENSKDASIHANPLEIERVVANLVENAIRYSPAGETVKVRADGEANGVTLEVTDTGTGIDPEHLPRLFERFSRVERSRPRQGGGAGLGLAIVKSLVEAHGGRVTVRTEVGKGSTFAVWLPRGSSDVR